MSKQKVQQQFGANAAAYATSTVHAKGYSLARLVEITQPQPDWQVLDVATAAGHTAFVFAPHVAHVIASDLTPEMLTVAAGLATEKGLSNVSFEPADAEALPYQDATFDLVTCRIAPHHFPDIQQFITE
ncbi:MAG: methyltransferase domain-containing protein, partial [Anaerolineales bacterium]|nr:methyltransferase domain-containing protein [Anaerolineales bacterium]